MTTHFVPLGPPPWLKWPSTLSTAYFGVLGPSNLAQMTVYYTNRPFCTIRNVHFRPDSMRPSFTESFLKIWKSYFKWVYFTVILPLKIWLKLNPYQVVIFYRGTNFNREKIWSKICFSFVISFLNWTLFNYFYITKIDLINFYQNEIF